MTWNRKKALPDGHRLYSSTRTFERMEQKAESQTYETRGTLVDMNLEERIVIERPSPYASIRLTPATLLPKTSKSITMENDGPSTPTTAKKWHKDREKFLASLPEWEDDIDEVRNWPTVTRYIRAGDETRAEAIAKYAAANDNLAADPIGAGVTFEDRGEMSTERVLKMRPTPNEAKRAGTGGLKFDKNNKLVEWKGSDGKWRAPKEQYEAVKGPSKSKESEVEDEFNSRMKDYVVLSNRHLYDVLTSPGVEFPITLPQSQYMSEGTSRYDAANTILPKKLTTTIDGQQGVPWSLDEYNAAINAYKGRITVLNGPALPRTKSGGFQDNMPSFVGLRIYGHGGHGDPVRISWEDKIIKRIDFRNAKKSMDKDSVLYLDLASTDSKAEYVGNIIGFEGKRAERHGVRAIDSAVDEFISKAA